MAIPKPALGVLFGLILVLESLPCYHGFIGPSSIGKIECRIGRPRSHSRPPLASSSREDDDDDDDEAAPEVDISNFKPPTASLGWNSGRSPPSGRKAMGRSSASKAQIFVCSNCGSEFVKFFGRCPTCKEWNTLQEHSVTREISSGPSKPTFSRSGGSWVGGTSNGAEGYAAAPIRLSDITKRESCNLNPRMILHDDKELNSVLGGGLMKGSLILIGGDPGVGKSTLMLQVAASISGLAAEIPGIGMGLSTDNDNESEDGGAVWYVSGEETPEQIASRASRLGLDPPDLFLLQETHIDTLCQQVVDYVHASNADDSSEIRQQRLALVVVDSIQTMVCEAAGFGTTGGVSQVRESMALLLRLAKSTGIPVVVIGHVTKSGDVAGPRTVEHMVDTVLYLEGEQSSNIRMLRASKNRFGSSDEVGVYEMTAGRLLPVSDPSSLFLATRDEEEDSEGCAVAVVIEGMRAIAVEVQALATAASGEYGRRTVNGIPPTRLSLLLGVLQKHAKISFARRDVYVNVVGRFQLERSHSADLSVCIALASSLVSIPIRGDTVFIGEVGLLGELRALPSMDKRIQEARRMGFSRVIAPCLPKRRQKRVAEAFGLKVIHCRTLLEALDEGLVMPLSSSTKQRSSKSKRGIDKIRDLGLESPILDDEDDDDHFM